MKVCVMVICELLAGGGVKECDRAIPVTIVEVPAITRYADCVQAARRVWSGEVPLPAGLRLQKIEMMLPEVQEARK